MTKPTPQTGLLQHCFLDASTPGRAMPPPSLRSSNTVVRSNKSNGQGTNTIFLCLEAAFILRERRPPLSCAFLEEILCLPEKITSSTFAQWTTSLQNQQQNGTPYSPACRVRFLKAVKVFDRHRAARAKDVKGKGRSHVLICTSVQSLPSISTRRPRAFAPERRRALVKHSHLEPGIKQNE